MNQQDYILLLNRTKTFCFVLRLLLTIKHTKIERTQLIEHIDAMTTLNNNGTTAIG